MEASRATVQPRVQVGVGDLLQVGQAEHVDVGLQQAAVGDRPADRGELELLAGHVELEESILPGRVVGPPDDVEAPAAPLPHEPGERAQRARHLRERLLNQVRQRRQRLEREIGRKFHETPHN
jgi:hypothetical protein